MEIEDFTPKLAELGFTPDQIALAKKHSTDKSFEGLSNWIVEHPDLEKFIEIETQGEAPKEGTEQKEGGAPEAEQPQGKSISALVNQDMAKELEAMGFSKNVREKSLLLTSSASIEAALGWIEQHGDDPDFEEELLLVQEDNKPKLSPEEALQKAKDLQIRLREVRKKRDEEEALEREKSRIAGGKALTDAKRIMDEQQRQRDIEFKMKEKKDDELAKQKILDELEKDRRERFGDKYVPTSVAAKEKPPIEQVKFGIRQMKTVYPPFTQGELLKVSWNTIKTVLGNIIKNPDEVKFQDINLGNPNFKARVVDIIGGVFVLTQCGFVEENGHLILRKKDLNLYKEVVALLEQELHALNL